MKNRPFVEAPPATNRWGFALRGNCAVKVLVFWGRADQGNPPGWYQ